MKTGNMINISQSFQINIKILSLSICNIFNFLILINKENIISKITPIFIINDIFS